MQQLTVPYLNIKAEGNYHLTEEVSVLLDGFMPHAIANAPWATEVCNTQAAFSMAYNDDFVFLKYYVTEPDIKAEYIRINDPVYKDSCVEFFIAFGNDAHYYNLEFNCVGNCLAGYGSGKTDRVNLPVAVIKQIQHQTMIKARQGGAINWQLTLCIPASVFIHHPALNLKQANARVNFYKCGDDLLQPHFLCWNAIKAQTPNFHLSQYFKEISFHKQVQYI